MAKESLPFTHSKFKNRLSFPKGTHVGKQELYKKVIVAYQGGQTLLQVGTCFGMTAENVRRILAKFNVPKIRRFKQSAQKHTPLVARYFRLGFTARQTAVRIGVCASQVSKILSAWKHSLTEDELRQIRAERSANQFWNRVDKKRNESDCWEWKGYRNPVTHYGRCRFKGRSDDAHRVAFELHYGHRATFHVLHSCDNPPCVNPAHLRDGTPLENMQDRDRRGRAGWQKDYEGFCAKIREGHAHNGSVGRRRFTDDQADEIRRRYLSGESSRKLAQEFKTHHSIITRIARGDVYRVRVDGTPMPTYEVSKQVHPLFGFKRNG